MMGQDDDVMCTKLNPMCSIVTVSDDKITWTPSSFRSLPDNSILVSVGWSVAISILRWLAPTAVMPFQLKLRCCSLLFLFTWYTNLSTPLSLMLFQLRSIDTMELLWYNISPILSAPAGPNLHMAILRSQIKTFLTPAKQVAPSGPILV